MTKRWVKALIICVLITYTLICTSYISPTAAANDLKNVILIGWDGVQRNHLFELLNRGLLPSLKSFINEGTIVNITVMDHRTDTKSGWTQILTGYRWWKTGVYNNVYWFHAIPAGYTIPERVESHFGKNNVVTAFITGKLGHMEVQSGTGTTQQGKYTHEAIYSNIPSQVDVCNVGDRNATVVGPLTLQFIENYANSHFFAFFHFSDPDSAGHNQKVGGENSPLYEQAIERCDYWLGQIVNKLNTLNITQNTLIYIAADHGFDEGGYSHNNAPYIFLATNDKNVKRNGDEVDVAPTIYYGLGMWGDIFNPALDGYPLHVDLPGEVEQKRQSILNDTTPPPKPSIIFPTSEADLAGTVVITFKVSDKHLSAVPLLIDNTLKADGPWTWHRNDLVEAYGSYDWDTTDISTGSHTITILAFDEHGATNGPSISTITVNVVTPDVLVLQAISSVHARSFTVSPIYLTILTPHKNVQLVTVNGSLYATDANGMTRIALYDPGVYILEAETPLSVGEGVRAVFTSWNGSLTENPLSVMINDDTVVTATYKTQYHLTVKSDYGEPKGGGWYDAGSTATFSVTTPMGFIVQKAFAGWNGDSNATTPTATIVMGAPKVVIANWRTDYIQLAIIVIGVVAVGGAMTIIIAKRKRKPH